MPTNLSQTDIANIALSKIGAQKIQAIDDPTSRSAIECATNWGLALVEVMRARPWNCLKAPSQLAAVPNPLKQPCDQDQNVVSTVWAPNTVYTAGAYITFPGTIAQGGYLYQVNFNLTSSANFTNDLTAGYYTQQNPVGGLSLQLDGSAYVSGWPYAWALPGDFVSLVELNGNPCQWDALGGDDWEIMGNVLYTNSGCADIGYIQNNPDTTVYDSLFVNALTFNLASKISTGLRKDGGQLAAQLLQDYEIALPVAGQKNNAERKVRRNSLQSSSRWVASRYSSTVEGSGF